VAAASAKRATQPTDGQGRSEPAGSPRSPPHQQAAQDLAPARYLPSLCLPAWSGLSVSALPSRKVRAGRNARGSGLSFINQPVARSFPPLESAPGSLHRCATPGAISLTLDRLHSACTCIPPSVANIFARHARQIHLFRYLRNKRSILVMLCGRVTPNSARIANPRIVFLI